MIEKLSEIVGRTNVLTGADAAPYGKDWTGKYVAEPWAVVRPANTAEVSAIAAYCSENSIPLVPVSGNTGLTGGTLAEGAVMISMARMNKIIDIRESSRIAIVEAGAVLSQLHEATDAKGMVFPLTFGAKGQAMIGGALATNAGGSNVVRYGNTRALCLGLELVLPGGRVLDLMSELRKDNSGYDLKDLFIGAEGTLGIITKAVLQLFPKPKAYATALVPIRRLEDALPVLNRLQAESGNGVEAFEFLPAAYFERLYDHYPKMRRPFDTTYETNLMIEVAAVSESDARPDDNGQIPLLTKFENALGAFLEEGLVLDALIAQSEQDRLDIWEWREVAGEITFTTHPFVNCDVSLPLEKIAPFLKEVTKRTQALDPSAKELPIAHLGDGNIHYTVYPTQDDKAHLQAIQDCIDELVGETAGSFSAEHGIGVSKLTTMAAHKDPVALDVMSSIKGALDPQNIMNPGKVLPSA